MGQMTVRTLVSAYFGVMVSFSACIGRRHLTGYDSPLPRGPAEPVMLQVQNHNLADLVLYIVHDGVETRFAEVGAAHDLSIEIPSRLQGQLGVIRLSARRIGGNDRFVSDAISLRGNSAVVLTIESSLSRSTVGVW